MTEIEELEEELAAYLKKPGDASYERCLGSALSCWSKGRIDDQRLLEILRKLYE